MMCDASWHWRAFNGSRPREKSVLGRSIMASQSSPRLHILMAREAAKAVVIRRGPSKQVCTIGWDRRTDTFTLGQWLKGRIYERRSDLSPRGTHLIYFAMNGIKSWTAISRAPYLKAVGFWEKGDCWHGGGLFLTEDEYWINWGYGHTVEREPEGLRRAEWHLHQDEYGSECTSVYYIRLQRDGWQLVAGPMKSRHSGLTVFEKPLPGGCILRKFARSGPPRDRGKGCYYDEHELEQPEQGQTLVFPTWEWAEFDRRRLVWTEAGKLFAAQLLPEGVGDATQLADFNAMKFEPIEAPY